VDGAALEEQSLLPAPVDLPDAEGANVDFRERLVSLPEGERRAAVLDLVRHEAAVVLGHAAADDVDPDLVIQELGLDSLGTVELRKRIAASTGVEVPVLALADNPTLAGAARYVFGQLDGPHEEEPGRRSNGGISLTSLLDDAREGGALDEFADLLKRASRFRRSFSSSADSDWRPRPVRLAEGPPESESTIVLLPSLGPMSGIHEYMRLARELGGMHSVLTMSLPGMGPGEALPASADAAIVVLVEAIGEMDLGSGLILGGHSSGGWLAQAVAARLESGAGAPPATVLLLDVFSPQSPLLSKVLPSILAAAGSSGAEAMVDDARLLALGAYWRIFAEWDVPPVAAETVLIQARQAAWEADGELQQETWELPHLLAEVEGDHFSMMTDRAGDTAAAIDRLVKAKSTNGKGGDVR
jgi:thioesterase domain-containing protein/acyl carrier protein